MANEIDIEGLDKATLLKALWEGSHEQGLSFLQRPPVEPTLETFQQIVKATPSLCFDYLLGRVIKCDISGAVLRPALYDRDCGDGACEKAVEKAMGGSNG